MSTLAHVFETAGLCTIVLASMREVAEKMAPPRALYCEFPLGRPPGRPCDPVFQRAVLDRAFALLDATESVLDSTPKGNDMTNLLDITQHDRVRIIRLNRPEKMNALSDELAWGIVAAVNEAAADPVERDPVPPQESGADTDKLMLLQVVADPATPDLAAGLDATRIGRFWIEDRFVGDHRTFAEARFDLISPAAAADLAAREFEPDDTGYVVIADPVMDEVARSLTDPTTVLF